ncbi:hypothetical protein ACO229_06845 [Promicromonospora sp. MS192]|uniref:hypothetical protein n=1 Tax=Promicromonospora sp. MS192 TaxID=3412684 RepID=UPI003C2FF0F4
MVLTHPATTWTTVSDAERHGETNLAANLERGTGGEAEHIGGVVLEPNTRLRAARQAKNSPSGSGRPMSRAELAELANQAIPHEQAPANLDTRAIGRYERGETRWPQEPYRHALRAVLGAATDADLGFFPTPRGRTVPGQPDDLIGWIERASALSAGDVLALARRTDQIRLQETTQSSARTSQLLDRHLATLASLRSFSVQPQVRAGIASVHSDAASLAGWVRLDAGDLEGAWRLHEVAKDAGRESIVPADLVHAIAQQAYVLVDAGQIQGAQRLAGHAIEIGARSVSPMVRAWLHAVLGEIGAIAGNQTTSLNQFDQAARLLPADGYDPDAPYLVLDEPGLARWRGAALARLGDEDAIANLQYALERLGDGHLRAAAQANVDLSHSLLAAGHPDQAVTVLRVGRDLATRAGSVRQLRRVAALELRLGVPSP